MPVRSDPPGRPPFPTLPIVTPDQPRRADHERYGALFRLGAVGLVVLVGLLGWFGWGVWSLRSVWTAIYVLNDPRRTEPERVRAAYQLSHDPRVDPSRRLEIALDRDLPAVTRYLAAESLRASAAAVPRRYGLMVARSEGWPGWLRLLLVRPIAYAASVGRPVDREALAELARREDPALVLWTRYAQAASDLDVEAGARLRDAAENGGPNQPLARALVEALDARRAVDRAAALDAATRWLRSGHPGAAEVWRRWDETDDEIVPRR